MRVNKNKSDYWLCKEAPKCKGAATILDNQILRKTEHHKDHMPDDPCKLDVLKMMMVMRERTVKEESTSLKTIIEQEMVKFVHKWGNINLSVYCKCFENIGTSLARIRTKQHGTVLPKTIEDINIQGEFARIDLFCHLLNLSIVDL